MGDRVWTVGEAMDWTVRYFEEREVEQPRRSAEWLLSASTELSRIELYAMRQRPLTQEERTEFRSAIERRVSGEPLQYVTGEMPFRRIVVKVEPGVFIPRPETEVLVDVGLEHIGSVEHPYVIDLCCGSGAVGVSVAVECEQARVWSTDLSDAAVSTASDNAERIGVAERVHILKGDLFEPLPDELRGRVQLVLANPPYIPTEAMADLPQEVASYEPALALDGGLDGLSTVRRIAGQASAWLSAGSLLAMEVDEGRAQDAAESLSKEYRDVFLRKDLTGRERIVGGYKEE